MKEDLFQSAIQTLGTDDAPRVWSLIVTVFGDLAQKQGDLISGPMLASILTPLGVRPEAMRVALHRLRNESWIETTKRGREAFHSLSATGLEQSVIASGRIYANEHSATPNWHVLCYPPALSNDEQSRAARLVGDGYIALSSGVYLANGPAQNVAKDALILEGSLGDIPTWLSASLVSNGLSSALKDLSVALELLSLDKNHAQSFTPFQIATLRTLIVHRWRKLALKLPDVPDALFGPSFEGTACRAQVLRTLNALGRPALSVLA
jgi:phenylacetic acid degradation operon negative regulatory protein